MGKLAAFFEFSSAQLRFLLVLSGLALVMAIYLLVHTLASPTPEAISLPVIVGDADRQFEGVFILDPNSAPVDSLELLPGVGRVIADRIVEYRRRHRFETVVDLTEVNGIGPRSLEKMRAYIRINRK